MVSPPSTPTNPTPQTWGPPTSYATKSDKIVCVMVGLPARGKSYIARRLAQYISFFYGAPTRVFNVGDYRRKAASGSFHGADFFDTKNEAALAERQKASEAALADLIQWMSETVPPRLDKDDLFLSGDFGAVGIFDATNTTRARRQWILDELRPVGVKVIFIESICNDPMLVASNVMTSKVSGPAVKDYVGVPVEEAVRDFDQRIEHYREVYEELGPEERHLVWIKMVDGGRSRLRRRRNPTSLHEPGLLPCD